MLAPGLPRRLTVAVAASIAIHAAVLGGHGPRGTASRGSAPVPVLHAFLAPQAQPAESAAADTPRFGEAEGGPGGADTADGLPAPERWFRRSELDSTAAPMTAVDLVYPQTAKSRRSAQVQVRLFIDERGLVRKITVESPGAERAFEEAAIRAWRNVRFVAAMKNGTAVKSQQVIEVDFQPDVELR